MLNPAHVPCWQVNNLTVSHFCKTGVGRADIEGSKSDVAMNAWPPQASYPYGNFSVTSGFNTLNIWDTGPKDRKAMLSQLGSILKIT